MDAVAPAYSHTQKSPLCLLVYGTAIALFVGAWFTQDDYATAITLTGAGVMSLFLASCFHYLIVEDQGEMMAIHFGPVPLFRRIVRYADIEKVEVGRTMILEGWGIHYSFRGGWVWNLYGRDCVVVRFRNESVLRIGTDDTEKLAGFLEGKIGRAA